LRKTGPIQKNGGNKQRNPNNRQGNSSSGSQSNQNPNSRSSGSRQPNQNPSSRNSGAGKKGIHPWVSSGPSSSQALTSHISMVSNKSEGRGNNRNKPQGQKRRNPSHQQRDNANTGRPRNQYDKAKRNNNAPSAAKPPQASSSAEQKLTGNLDAFSLFCAYHLGIGPNKEYKLLNINEVARRFGQDQGVVKQALKECNMDSAALLDKDFDMALAQLDIQVAPEGIDKMELAKSIYEDFLEAPNVKRDWKKIIEEDRKENRKVFG
jgi:hypothetical protein